MATTAEAAALSETHRARQLALRALVTRQLIELWPAFDIRDIDLSWARMESSVLTLVSQGRQLSSALAVAYFREFRVAEQISGAVPNLAPLNDAWETAARVSLHVRAPVEAKRLIKNNAQQVAEKTFVAMDGAATRVVLNGGRDSLGRLIRQDARALGFARVTDGDPCAFCALLAGRGPVYKSERTAGFDAHDHCACFSEPVYSRNAAWPGRGRDFEAIYKRATVGEDDKLNAFRRAYEGR